MAEIILRSGEVVLVDTEDFEELSGYQWYIRKDPTSPKLTSYAWRADGPGHTMKMHRHLTKPADGIEVDHINGNGLDNRRCNLRFCTRQENMRNARKKMWRGKASSRFKGVKLDHGKWEARITMSKKAYYLGRFKDEVAAANAYDQAAREHFGAFARVNFPYGIG